MNNIKQIIAGLVIVGVIIGGAIALRNRPLTYEEYKQIIAEFNTQTQYILNNCDIDTRCVIIEGEKRVYFGQISGKKQVVKVFKEWVGKGNAAYVR